MNAKRKQEGGGDELYRYFVSYQVSAHDGFTSGFGHCESRIPFKVMGLNEIKFIAENIEKKNRYEKGSVIILNYKVFDDK